MRTIDAERAPISMGITGPTKHHAGDVGQTNQQFHPHVTGHIKPSHQLFGGVDRSLPAITYNRIRRWVPSLKRERSERWGVEDHLRMECLSLVRRSRRPLGLESRCVQLGSLYSGVDQ